MAPELLGTIPQWFTVAGVASILGIVLRYRLGWKRLNIEDQKQKDTDEADIRDHYADEVRQLRDKLDKQSGQFRRDLTDLEDRYRGLLEATENRWQRLLSDSEKRHDECMADRDHLRERVNALENELNGLIRMIAQNSANKVLQLGDDVSDDIRAAAERVEIILKKGLT